MTFDLEDTCEGLLVLIEDIANALHARNLRSAESATDRLLGEIQEAREAEDEAEDADEDDDLEEDED